MASSAVNGCRRLTSHRLLGGVNNGAMRIILLLSIKSVLELLFYLVEKQRGSQEIATGKVPT